MRESEWTVAPVPRDLQDRRVEITGPTDRKMVINALNCGANVFMADFEDSNTPTWENMIEGQVNLRDAVDRTIEFVEPRRQALRAERAAPRRCWCARAAGTSLENHVHVDGAPVSGAIFDFALYFFHNAKALLARNSGPYFYLPKMESHLEARLWNDDLRRGAARARRAAGHDQGHRADRDRARRLRDGRDPATSCASTAPGSTSGAGTTSSAASRNSAPTRISAWPTARR